MNGELKKMDFWLLTKYFYVLYVLGTKAPASNIIVAG